MPVDQTHAGQAAPAQARSPPPRRAIAAYGNQIGLATGHGRTRSTTPAMSAKRLEIGAVIGAAPGAQRPPREPAPGRCDHPAGRRAPAATAAAARPAPPSPTRWSRWPPAARRCRRATRPRSASSSACSATREVTRMIKRCNDFGAGGVSVAIGELADGLDIDLDARAPQVRRPGRHGAGHLRIPGAHGRWWSRRRMWTRSSAAADEENLEATVVGRRSRRSRGWRWTGTASTIVDISREFLNSNGAPKHTAVRVVHGTEKAEKTLRRSDLRRKDSADLVGDLNICSQKRPGRAL